VTPAQIDAIEAAILTVAEPQIQALVIRLAGAGYGPEVAKWLLDRFAPAIRLAITPILTAPVVTVTDDRTTPATTD
jgi:hypothetical protein